MLAWRTSESARSTFLQGHIFTIVYSQSGYYSTRHFTAGLSCPVVLFRNQMWSQLLHYVRQGLDAVGYLLTAREVFKGFARVLGGVLFALFLLFFGRTPVLGLGNISFNPFSNAPVRPAVKWGTLLALVVCAGLVLSHVRRRDAISA
jgi:hypothetical protein